MRAITERELSFALNCLSIDAKVETPDFELAEKLVDKVFENRGTHPSLTGNPVEPKIVVSIQLACTFEMASASISGYLGSKGLNRQ